MGIEFAQVATALMSMLLEGLPFIFLGTLVSGFIDAYLPSGLMERVLPRNHVVAILLSGLLGLIFPVCECAIVPVIGRLIRKGLPVSCAITYMLSAPIINPITIISTMSAFSGKTALAAGTELLTGETANHALFVTGSRLLIAYVITVAAGLIVHRFTAESILKPALLNDLKKASDGELAHTHEGPRLVTAMRATLRDCVDTGMYFTIGAALTAVFNTSPLQVTAARFMGGHVLIAVSVMMLLAFILSLCSTSDAFVAATLKVGGLSAYSSKLAFLAFGPMVDVKLLFMYSSIFRVKFVWILVVSLFIAIGLLCSAWNLLPINRIPF